MSVHVTVSAFVASSTLPFTVSVASGVINQSVTVFNSAGHTNNSAPVPHVLVPAVTSAGVDFSTLPATVSLALGVLAPPVSSIHAPAWYFWKSQTAVLYTLIQLLGEGIAVSLAVSSAYIASFVYPVVITLSNVCVHVQVLLVSVQALLLTAVLMSFQKA